MSERLTDKGLADIIKRITCADDCPKCASCGGDGFFQAGDRNWRCEPCEGTGMFALSTRATLSALTELRTRRSTDRDIARLADACRDYHRRHGMYPLWATEALLELLPKGEP